MKSYLKYQYHNPYASIVKPIAYEYDTDQTQESTPAPVSDNTEESNED